MNDLPSWARRYPVAQDEITGDGLDEKLEQLTRINVAFLVTHPRFPLLYESGVRYRRSPLTEECWLPAPWCKVSYETGRTSDCKSLATWRAAELRARWNDPARCFWTRQRVNDRGLDLMLYHILVRRGDGSVEDPSLLLGMRARPGARASG